VDTLRRFLAGLRVESVKHTGDKIVRAGPVASYAETGSVRVVEGGWTRDFMAELEAFPNGTHDDQVDALSLGFNFLVGKAVGVSAFRPEKREPCSCGGAVLTVGQFHAPWCPVKPAARAWGMRDALDAWGLPTLWRN
jgi:hypothetical protein